MYCELFRLKEPPFRLTPDPQFLFASKQHARAKAYMESTIWLADGFVVITGDIGSGKTTLIESFLSELGEDVVIAHINQTQLSPVEFLQAVLVELGFKPFKMQKIELLTMLRDHMIEQYAAGKKVLLIIDEAQNLSRQVLEEVRMLSGIEAQKEKLLRIILAGQPELAQKLDSPRLEQLTQRVRLRFHLGSLSKRETRDYIEHRLRIAGADRAVFSDDAFDVVFRYSGGVPRLTNILCDTAMLCAFAEERDTVDAALVKAAVEELQWVDYAERVRGREPAHSRERRELTSREPGAARRGSEERRSAGHAPAERGSSVDLPGVDLLFRDEIVSHHSLPPGRAIIGRTPDNDVQIQSKFVSRHHAQIITEGERCVIEDLNSTNGIFLGVKRVKQHVLADGDVIQIGEHKLLFRADRSGSPHGDPHPGRGSAHEGEPPASLSNTGNAAAFGEADGKASFAAAADATCGDAADSASVGDAADRVSIGDADGDASFHETHGAETIAGPESGENVDDGAGGESSSGRARDLAGADVVVVADTDTDADDATDAGGNDDNDVVNDDPDGNDEIEEAAEAAPQGIARKRSSGGTS